MDFTLQNLLGGVSSRDMEKKDIASYSFEELKIEMERIGEKAFRAKQIYEWLHKK